MTLPGNVPDSVCAYYAASGIALALILSTTVIIRWNRMMLYSNTSVASMPPENYKATRPAAWETGKTGLCCGSFFVWRCK